MDKEIDTLAIVGVGYVGLVTAVCLAARGIKIIAVERDNSKLAKLKAGIPVIYEDGLRDLLTAGIESGRLYFTSSLEEALITHQARVVMLAVGTPQDPISGRANLSAIEAVMSEASDIAETHQLERLLLVNKSTVPVGTAAALTASLKARRGGNRLEIASNPEFLREGKAIQDFMHPDRIVIGAYSEQAAEELRSIYRTFVHQGVAVKSYRPETAELVKHAANSFLALKIGFINQIGDLCEVTGADVQEVAEGIGLDRRIGAAFLQAGPGYGGSCFPKDSRELAGLARELDTPLTLIEAVIAANDTRRQSLGKRLEAAYGASLSGKRIGILGLAFKAGTDDVRESPAQELIPWLVAAGAKIIAHDPIALDEAKKHWPPHAALHYADSLEEVLASADMLIILTEWPLYAQIPAPKLAGLKDRFVFDCRNLLSPALVKAAGVRYQGLGRKL